MSAKHPYISGASSVATMISKLRSSFPPTVDSSTVKKFGLAPNNESYVINALQFIGAIDEDGGKTEKAAQVFSNHSDIDFQAAFEEMVREAYSDLFDLYGDASWEQDKDALITFFRNSDQTSAVIGGRQANLFQTFAALAGHGELKSTKSPPTSGSKTASKTNTTKASKQPSKPKSNKGKEKLVRSESLGVGLSVRIEVNLPSDATPETYDAIFASIRKHLIDN